MTHIVYIGDEATAAAYRLAGVETRIVRGDETREALQQAGGEGAELVLLAATHAAELPVQELEAALVVDAPLLAIVTDVLGGGVLPDLERQVRGALGIEP